MKNYLSFRASRPNIINAVIAFGGVCCCLGTQSCKTIIQRYFFDDRLFSGISERPKQHFRCCGTFILHLHLVILQTLQKQDQSAASQFIWSHSAKSQDFFDALGGIYSQITFPSPIICIKPLSHMSKTTSSEH